MRSTTLLPLLVGTAAASSTRKHGSGETGNKRVYKEQNERALSSSGDIDFDDDFWAYDQGLMDVVWDDYLIDPKKCMI